MGSDDDRDKKAKVVETALNPVAEEFAEASKGAGTSFGESAIVVARTVEVLLTPLRGLIWGYDQIKGTIIPNIQEKMKNVPENRRIQPNPMIGGPAIEALRFAGHNDELRELFENVLATSMDTETAANAHPAFVEIIKQLSSDEARILRYLAKAGDVPVVEARRHEGGGFSVIAKNITQLGELAGCKNLILVQAAIDNLYRLEICVRPPGVSLRGEGVYEPLENHPELKALMEKEAAKDGVQIKFERGVITLTMFGKQFIDACVVAKP